MDFSAQPLNPPACPSLAVTWLVVAFDWPSPWVKLINWSVAWLNWADVRHRVELQDPVSAGREATAASCVCYWRSVYVCLRVCACVCVFVTARWCWLELKELKNFFSWVRLTSEIDKVRWRAQIPPERWKSVTLWDHLGSIPANCLVINPTWTSINENTPACTIQFQWLIFTFLYWKWLVIQGLVTNWSPYKCS